MSHSSDPFDIRTEAAPFGNVDKFPKVEGTCPACGRDSLFLASGGYVTCSIIGCTDPGKASDVLARHSEPAVSDDARAVWERAHPSNWAQLGCNRVDPHGPQDCEFDGLKLDGRPQA